MKGDYYFITYRLPSGVATEKVQATRDGATVAATYPGRNDPWLVVEELNKANNPVRTCRFAISEVISIVQGHETLARPRVRVGKK